MSIAYDSYLKIHCICVKRAIDWIFFNVDLDTLNNLFPELNTEELKINIDLHDDSKSSSVEYKAYDEYFYGKKTEEVKKNFDYAWLHHLHCNPHHWQYWVLKEDDTPASADSMMIKCLEIPDVYILEMIADWWSFSWKTYIYSHDLKDLYEIFNWYDDHILKICLHDNTKKKVEALLSIMHDILDKQLANKY